MWSETGERLPYNPEWEVEPSDNTHNATSPSAEFCGAQPTWFRRVDRTVECSVERSEEVTCTFDLRP